MTLPLRWQERLLTQRWCLAVRARRPGLEAFLDPADYQLLPQPADEFRADPFLVEHGGDTWIFFERYRFREAKGHLAAGRLEANAAGGYHLVDVVTILERDSHLSFPCIFKAQGMLWMVPESVDRRTVELYRCLQFPARWELDRVLLSDVYLADCTVFEFKAEDDPAFDSERRWGMLAAELQPLPGEPYRHELRFYAAPGHQGPWIARPLPKAGVGSAGTRSAGAIFRESTEGGRSRLVWPTQDCTQRYGGAIQFCALEEVPGGVNAPATSWLGSLLPIAETGCQGVHTYGQSSRYEVIDQLYPVFAPGLKLQGLLGKVARRFTR